MGSTTRRAPVTRNTLTLTCIARRRLPSLPRRSLGAQVKLLRVRALPPAAAPKPIVRRGAVTDAETRSMLNPLVLASATIRLSFSFLRRNHKKKKKQSGNSTTRRQLLCRQLCTLRSTSQTRKNAPAALTLARTLGQGLQDGEGEQRFQRDTSCTPWTSQTWSNHCKPASHSPDDPRTSQNGTRCRVQCAQMMKMVLTK